MPYYPKSQIKTNLYTSGGEYSLEPPNNATSQPSYIGYYYKISTGRAFTGKTPSEGASQILYPLRDILDISNPHEENTVQVAFNYNKSFLKYNTLLSDNFPKSRLMPSYNPTIPTKNDYQLGVFTRYFCKKNNEFKYIEIDKKTYNLLNSKSPDAAWDIYSPLYTLWYLTGNKDNVAKTNKGLINLIEQQQNWYGFSQYLKDQYLKYYLDS